MNTDDEIVITGMSGKFPECENINEFMEALFDNVDLVTENDRRFKAGNFLKKKHYRNCSLIFYRKQWYPETIWNHTDRG